MLNTPCPHCHNAITEADFEGVATMIQETLTTPRAKLRDVLTLLGIKYTVYQTVTAHVVNIRHGENVVRFYFGVDDKFITLVCRS